MWSKLNCFFLCIININYIFLKKMVIIRVEINYDVFQNLVMEGGQNTSYTTCSRVFC